jgi:hypothetical protein
MLTTGILESWNVGIMGLTHKISFTQYSILPAFHYSEFK